MLPAFSNKTRYSATYTRLPATGNPPLSAGTGSSGPVPSSTAGLNARRTAPSAGGTASAANCCGFKALPAKSGSDARHPFMPAMRLSESMRSWACLARAATAGSTGGGAGAAMAVCAAVWAPAAPTARPSSEPQAPKADPAIWPATAPALLATLPTICCPTPGPSGSAGRPALTTLSRSSAWLRRAVQLRAASAGVKRSMVAPAPGLPGACAEAARGKARSNAKVHGRGGVVRVVRMSSDGKTSERKQILTPGQGRRKCLGTAQQGRLGHAT